MRCLPLTIFDCALPFHNIHHRWLLVRLTKEWSAIADMTKCRSDATALSNTLRVHNIHHRRLLVRVAEQSFTIVDMTK
jgi:hypothetical protein